MAPNTGTEENGVEAVLVVTVENNGAEDVMNENEPSVLEIAEADEAEAEAALVIAKEGWETEEVRIPKENPEELDDVVAAIVLAGAEGFANAEDGVVEEEAPPNGVVGEAVLPNGVVEELEGVPPNGVVAEAVLPNRVVEELEENPPNDVVEADGFDDGALPNGVVAEEDVENNKGEPEPKREEAVLAGAVEAEEQNRDREEPRQNDVAKDAEEEDQVGAEEEGEDPKENDGEAPEEKPDIVARGEWLRVRFFLFLLKMKRQTCGRVASLVWFSYI